MFKKQLAVLLLLALLLGIAVGCAKAPATTDTPASATDSTTPSTSEPAEVPADTPADAEPEKSPADIFPLAETVVFTGWTATNIDMAPNDKLQDTPGHQWLHEQTNVLVEWDNVSENAATEQFNLMLVAGNYPNIIMASPAAYPGGLQSCIDQEILMDISSYIEGGYAPNYQALREADDELRKDTMLDSGAMPGFYRVLTSKQNTFIGWTVRADLARELGFDLEEVNTLDEYHDLVTAFANYGLETPCELIATGFDTAFMTTYGLTGAFFGTGPFRQVNGQVQYSLIQPEYYDYLTTVKQWYDEGLFDKEFNGVTGSIALNNDIIASGQVGIFNMLATQGKLVKDLSGCEYQAVPSPVLEEGGTRKVAQNGGCASRLDGVFTGVSTSAENLEILVPYLDYMFSDEAYLPLNFGIEGKTYVIDESGNAVYTQEFMDSPDGWVRQMRYYCAYNTVSNLFFWESQKVGQADEVLYAYNIWDKYYEEEYTMPTLSLTAEESEDYGSHYSDIQTYASEMVLKFILGIEPLNEESYAKYVKNIESMGIQTCVDVYQTAYERYQAR